MKALQDDADQLRPGVGTQPFATFQTERTFLACGQGGPPLACELSTMVPHPIRRASKARWQLPGGAQSSIIDPQRTFGPKET